MSNLEKEKAIRETLLRMGKSYSDVARELGVDLTVVQGVICGRLKGKWGDAHKVAVTLGLKDGVIVADNVPLADAIKALRAA
ncbi:MAG: hypothetical protein ABI673_02610 [Novosphingobium sp.]